MENNSTTPAIDDIVSATDKMGLADLLDELDEDIAAGRTLPMFDDAGEFIVA